MTMCNGENVGPSKQENEGKWKRNNRQRDEEV